MVDRVAIVEVGTVTVTATTVSVGPVRALFPGVVAPTLPKPLLVAETTFCIDDRKVVDVKPVVNVVSDTLWTSFTVIFTAFAGGCDATNC